jgi:hypothetical protein
VNTREIAIASVTGAVVVSALGWTLVIRPTIEGWRESHERAATAQDQLDKANSLIKRKGELRAERDTIERAIQPTEPPAGQAPLELWDADAAFLEHLRDLTSAAGIPNDAIQDLRSVRAEPYDAYAEIHYELRAHATLKQIEEFLVRMTASEWYLRVSGIQIQPRTDSTVEVDMSLVGLASQDVLEDSEKDTSKGKGKRK